jgi:hypothetical protein
MYKASAAQPGQAQPGAGPEQPQGGQAEPEQPKSDKDGKDDVIDADFKASSDK